jgi:hypothetical protein
LTRSQALPDNADSEAVPLKSIENRLTVDGRVKKMKIARIICWQLDSTLRPTLKRGFDIIPAQPELI